MAVIALKGSLGTYINNQDILDNIQIEKVQATGEFMPAVDKDIILVQSDGMTHTWKCVFCGETWKTYTDSSKKYQNKVVCPNKAYHGLGYSLEELHTLRLNRTLKEVQQELHNEYDESRNTKKVDNITIGDTAPRVWECSKCGYRWKLQPFQRYNAKTGEVSKCPKCSAIENKQIQPRKNQKRNEFGLAYHRPMFISYFDNENNDFSIFDLANKTSYEVAWKCYRCGYTWKRKPVYTFPKYVCPACSHLLIAGKNDIGTACKEQSVDFGSKYNGRDVSTVHFRTKAKMHWKCHKCGHTSMISPIEVYKNHRTCIICDTVQNRCPEILKDLDNQDDVEKIKNTRIDSRISLNWKCSRGHKYTMSLKDRVQHFYGCPTCRKNNWAYTKLKQELTKNNIFFEELWNTPDIGKVQASLVVNGLMISVVSNYNTLGTRDEIHKLQEFALSNGYRYIQVIETTDENVNDILKTYESFVIPMDYQDINIRQIVKWLIHYENIK